MNKILLKNITNSSISQYTDPMYDLFIFKDIEKYYSYVFADFDLNHIVQEIESLFKKDEISEDEKKYILETYLNQFEKVLLEIEKELTKNDLDVRLKLVYKKNKKKFSECIEYLNEELKDIKPAERGNIDLANKENEILQLSCNNLEWENKTELAEFIQALYLSKIIKKNGKEIQQNELIEIFSNLFNTDLKTFNTLLNQGINSKTKKLFTEKLFDLVNNYKNDKDKLKKTKVN